VVRKITVTLPSDYLDIVVQGATTLRSLRARLRHVASNHPDASGPWLSVRDYESLAQRLTESSEWEWRHGIADTIITSVDFAVLDELLTSCALPLKLSHEDSSAIARLNEFLHRYCRREFELDEPVA
jgi:hypothetical protein